MDPVYARLVELNEAAPVNPDAIHAFMVDEYEGLDPADPRSYNAYLRERVFAPLQLTHVHPMNEATYERTIKAVGGIDLQMLGLGLNGHIGFNEPGSSRDSRTRKVEIAQATRQANSTLFAGLEEVPTHAVSIGIATILDAKEIWVLASGASKKKIVKELNRAKVSSQLPASFLKEHPKTTLFLDKESAGE